MRKSQQDLTFAKQQSANTQQIINNAKASGVASTKWAYELLHKWLRAIPIYINKMQKYQNQATQAKQTLDQDSKN